MRGALFNGATLGIGGTTRIGYCLWYVVPLAAFLSGSPYFGAISFGLYGFARAIVPMIAVARLRLAAHTVQDVQRLQGWLVSRAGVARQVAAVNLLLIGVIALVCE